MGRRKIEIQPITHERNRSVTFLKRKNGLFKKAYELGVLCSVDVTVIIFEKAGTHNEKLYEYCSTNDSDAQVSKRIDWEGDRDARGPADFGGEKHQHPGLLVPSTGQDYDDDDGDGDGDGDSTEEAKDPKRKKAQTSKDRRSSDEMSSAPRHALSHPSLPTPISTYLPTATLPVSDQRGSPHTSTPPSAHGQPPKRARRESSGYPLPTPILPNPPLPASLLAHPHSPPYYTQENAVAYRSLFDMPSGGAGAAQYQYAQHPAYRRPGAVHLSGGAGGYASPGPGSGAAYHAPQYAHSHAAMFPGANPFASLLAASGAGGGGGASGGAPGPGGGGGGAAGGFDLEWPVHNAGPPPPPTRSPPRAQTPERAPQQNGAARAKGGAGPGGEDAEDATSWLDYLAGIPARRDPPARDMEVDGAPPAPPAPAPAPAAEEQRSSSSEQGTPRKRKHEG